MSSTARVVRSTSSWALKVAAVEKWKKSRIGLGRCFYRFWWDFHLLFLATTAESEKEKKLPHATRDSYHENRHHIIRYLFKCDRLVYLLQSGSRTKIQGAL